MDEKTISHNVNFEIQKLFLKNNKNGIRKILKQFEIQLNNRSFDTTTQNLQIANFFVSLNPDRFLNELDKQGILIPETIKNPDTTKSISQQTARFYLVYNWFYFSKLTQRNRVFLETDHFSFRGSLKSLTALPTFPILKIFLSKMNYFFDSSNKVRIFEHIEEIHRLIDYGRELKTTKTRVLLPQKPFNSCIYGGTFFQLANLEQNNFNGLELQIAGGILLAVSNWFACNNSEMDKNLTDLREKLNALKEDTVSTEKTDDKLILIEEKLPVKLFSHIEACIEYLHLLRRLRLEDHGTLTEILYPGVFYKDHRLEEKYYLPMVNLLGLLNFKNKSQSVAHVFFSRLAVSASGKLAVNNEKLDRFEGLSRLNNPLMRISLTYNLFASLFCIGEFAKAVELADCLISTFSSNYKFWYILGLCHFKLWEKEKDRSLKKEWEEAGRTVREATRVLEKRRIKLLINSESSWESTSKKPVASTPKDTELDDCGKTMILATSCLETSLNLLTNFYCKEHLGVIFQPSNARYKEYFNQIKILINVEVQKYLASVLEYLAYLYLSANKPMQALKAISLSLSSVKLKSGERAKLAVYHLKAAMMLKKTVLIKTSLGDLDNSMQGNDKHEFVFKKTSGSGTYILPVQFVLKYSKLMAVSKDKEQAKNAMQRLLEEWSKLGQKDKDSSERLLRKALFFYYSKIEFSRELLRHVLNPSYEISNFVSAKNGKIPTSI